MASEEVRPYEQPEAGGTWEHRSGDCDKHGLNVPFAKPYKSDELFECVECLKLKTLQEWFENWSSF